MSDDELIDREVIDAYRAEHMPDGFMHGLNRRIAAEQTAVEFPWRWAIASVAAAAIAVAVWQRDDTYPSETIALSMASMPAGLPTLSQVSTPALSSVRPIGSLNQARTVRVRAPSMGELQRLMRETENPVDAQ